LLFICSALSPPTAPAATPSFTWFIDSDNNCYIFCCTINCLTKIYLSDKFWKSFSFWASTTSCNVFVLPVSGFSAPVVVWFVGGVIGLPAASNLGLSCCAAATACALLSVVGAPPALVACWAAATAWALLSAVDAVGLPPAPLLSVVDAVGLPPATVTWPLLSACTFPSSCSFPSSCFACCYFFLAH
jgi:hypothetical protein